MSKVDQKVGVEDIIQSPVAVNIGSNDLALSLETLGTHSVKSALNFHLVGRGSVSLKKSSVSPQQAEGRSRSYLGSISVSKKKIGFVGGLETDNPIAENFLTHPDNIHPPVGGIVPRNTCESAIKGYRDEEHQM